MRDTGRKFRNTNPGSHGSPEGPVGAVNAGRAPAVSAPAMSTYLNQDDAAARLGITVDHLRGLTEAHGIPVTLVNGLPMYADDLVEIVAERRRQSGLA